MDMVSLTIDGRKAIVPAGSTIIEAAAAVGVKIPALCYHPELKPEGACRVCVVEIKGGRGPVASCVFPVSEGMEVYTNTASIRNARKTVVELLLANHPQDCLTCQRNTNCELQAIAADLGVREIPFEGEKKHCAIDDNNPSLVRDQNKCILCGRCIRACNERQEMHVYSFINRGFNTMVSPAFDLGIDKVACTYCGQCASVCPTAAIVERDNTEDVFRAINDPSKHVVVQTAPAVRVALGEDLGMGVGGIVTGKMVAALRRLGFDGVFDTDFTADLTIMEEGFEFLGRLNNGGTLPMITSCSPGWVNFIELQYPDLLGHLSTCKSPQQMFGALAKTFYAKQKGIDAKDIVSISVMPCTAKKAEAVRPEMRSSGYQDVDYVITTRELARMIKSAGVDFSKIPEEQYDAPLGLSTGAAVIFGASGGVMEAALRTVYEVVTKETLACLDFKMVRGLEGIKEATVNVGGIAVKVAVAHTLANAKILMDKIRAGTADYHFIEIMACPGGCIGGGGQPFVNDKSTRQERIDAIYECDSCMPIRQSHKNPAITALYEQYLGEPNGHKSHELLHTHYNAQKR